MDIGKEQPAKRITVLPREQPVEQPKREPIRRTEPAKAPEREPVKTPSEKVPG